MSERFKEEGINVNFVIQREDTLYVRTYERGVEDETLACGTGVTAAAIAASINNQKSNQIEWDIQAQGGQLSVRLERDDEGFRQIWLTGPATFVFQGTIDID